MQPGEAPLPAPRRPGREALLVFAAALTVIAAFAWVRDLWDADEGRYAAVALDMRRSGDFVTPREAGMRFVDKPPLLYWMEDGAFAVLGPSPFAARLPCLVAGAAFCALIFLLSTRWTGERRAAWLAAMTAATSTAGMGFSRVSPTTDMPLAASILGAILAGQAALTSSRRGPRLALGACVGLGLLAKGPVAAVVPILVALSWIVVGVDAKRVLRAVFSPTAWVVALVIAAPWYALMQRANPDYLRHFLVYEHFQRYTEQGYKEFDPIWFYVPLLPLGVFPWTHLLLRARLRRPLDVGRKAPVPAERLAWAWVLVCLVFFSLGRNKLVTYILPAFPPLFVLIGARLSDRLGAGEAAARRLGWWAFATGAVVALSGAAIETGLAFDAHVLHDERLRPIGLPIALAGVGLLAAPLFFISLRAARSAASRGAALVLASAALWWGGDLAAAHVDSLRSSRALAETLVAYADPDDVIVALDHYPQGLRFYADLDVKIAENPLHPGQKHTQREIVEPWASYDGAGRLLTMADLRALWSGPQRVLLVARAVDVAAEFPNAFRLATSLSGAQRSDLVVAENRSRAR